MPSAQREGARICFEVSGAGPPVVLVLPQSRGPAGREGLVAALRQQHQVVAFDARGSGRSDPAHDYAMEALAADLLAVLDAAGLGRALLACHSTGCGVGLALATAQPGRISGLVLAAPWSHGDAFLAAMQALRIEAARTLDPLHYARFNAALLFPPQYRRERWQGFTEMEAGAARHPQDAGDIARRLGAIVAFDARPLLARIACPVTVLAARDDQLMPPWHARTIAEGLAQARLELLDSGGHMLPETRREAFVAAVASLATQVARAEG